MRESSASSEETLLGSKLAGTDDIGVEASATAVEFDLQQLGNLGQQGNAILINEHGDKVAHWTIGDANLDGECIQNLMLLLNGNCGRLPHLTQFAALHKSGDQRKQLRDGLGGVQLGVAITSARARA